MKLYVLEEWDGSDSNDHGGWIIVAIVDDELRAQHWEAEDFTERRYAEYSLNEL